uniref:Uncharacterized protein n=1 Tax=Escherichia coli TaxID=562 RepID=A0A7T3V7H6_ECOLX|nr:hypothetical protein [Escherichia coli]
MIALSDNATNLCDSAIISLPPCFGYIRFLHIQCNRIFATVGKNWKE